MRHLPQPRIRMLVPRVQVDSQRSAEEHRVLRKAKAPKEIKGITVCSQIVYCILTLCLQPPSRYRSGNPERQGL